MPFDFRSVLGEVRRSVSELDRDGVPARGVTLERSFPTSAEDLWDAVTNSERLPRWFLPVSGDLRLGGRYQLEGNAGGTINECDPPRLLMLSWEFGGGVSWVEVRIVPEATERACLTLVHVCPVDDFWRQYGPGGVGTGWDLGILGLASHLSDTSAGRFDEERFAASPEGRHAIAEGSADWARAAIAAGEDTAQARIAGERTRAFYTGDPAPEE